MKVFVQIINTQSGISQHGMIEEPTFDGQEISNALKHFGTSYGEIEWNSDFVNGEVLNNPRLMQGYISGTSKVITVVAV